MTELLRNPGQHQIMMEEVSNLEITQILTTWRIWCWMDSNRQSFDKE